MVYFPDNYFEKEIRNGFEVSSMMKREIGRASCRERV